MSEFKVNVLMATKNECYKSNTDKSYKYYAECLAFQKNGPEGIMVHSTAANNPYLKRYVGPNDGKLGENKYKNYWNQPDFEKCVHAFIGKLENGTVATYQILPWNYRAWHCGGDGNNTHIGFEICEDDLKDAKYFNAVYEEAAQLSAYLCEMFNLPASKVICHSEGYKKGIASNHGDVMHWFPKHGKSMDTFRGRVQQIMNEHKQAQQKAEEAKKEEQKKEENKTTTTTSSTSYKVKVNVDKLNYRKGPGTNYKINGTVKRGEIYTIVEEKNGWGKLKSGAGWINLSYTKKVSTTTSTSTTKKEETKAPTYTTYTTKADDTLWGIASKLLGAGKRYTEIMELNNLKNTIINEGMKLKIPQK